jgi:hypothetical protein
MVEWVNDGKGGMENFESLRFIAALRMTGGEIAASALCLLVMTYFGGFGGSAQVTDVGLIQSGGRFLHFAMRNITSVEMT